MSNPAPDHPGGGDAVLGSTGRSDASNSARPAPGAGGAGPAGQAVNVRRGPQIRIASRGRISIEERREDVREFLTRRLVWVLVLTLLLGTGLMVTRDLTGVSAEDARLFFQVAFTAVISLVSAATGFYFGSSAGRVGGHRGTEPDLSEGN